MKKIVVSLVLIIGVIVTISASAALKSASNYKYCYKNDTNISMAYSDARAIASSSGCTQMGNLLTKHWCNEGTGTWWIAMRPYKNNPMCHPACVVDVVKGTASINWMCTGGVMNSDKEIAAITRHNVSIEKIE
jgi:hypothetical protein